MITLQGARTLPYTPDQVFDRLGDASFLATCLGPLISCQADADAAVFQLKPSMGIVSGTINGQLSILERHRADRIKVEQRMKGSGFTARVELAIALAPIGESTEVTWKADVLEATGLLRLVPNSIIRSAAEKAVGEIWADVEAKLP